MIYKVFDKFIIRTPIYSFEYIPYISIYDKKSFKKTIRNRKFKEAIYLATPVLYKEICKLEKRTLNKKEEKKVINSLNRYLSRMATRCTPFGLFASCSIGNISNRTDIILGDTFLRKTRLDMLFLCRLITEIITKCSNSRYFTNLSLYKTKQYYRYVEYKQLDYKRLYTISMIKRNKYLDNLLIEVDKGKSLTEMITYLEQYEVPYNEAFTYIQDLIKSQLIVSELLPTITGEDLLKRILDLIENQINTTKLKEIQEALHNLDKKQNNTINDYQAIISNIENLQVPYEEKYLFQVDSYRELEHSSISKNIIEDLKDCLCFLNKITNRKTNKDLEDFKQAYYRRYENQIKPLLEVLDPELGIGYPVNTNIKNDPFIDNFNIPSKTIENNYLSNILYNRIFNNYNINDSEIVFSDEDVKDIDSNWDELPITMYCMFKLYYDHKDHLIEIKSIGGSSGANLLSRFAHINEGIYEFAKEITDMEQKIVKDAIMAEIVHLPESRVGNIIHRPHLRDFEIAYLTPSDLPKERIIKLEDLFVTIRNNKLILYSKKLKKEIIPCLTTAHNYHTNKTTPIYKFLCDLQLQNKKGALGFDWGDLKNKLTFFPRIRYKKIILSPSIWKVSNNEITFLTDAFNSNSKDKINEWLLKRHMPHKISVMDGDNELFIDWNNENSISSALTILKSKKNVFFTEFIFNNLNSIVHDKKGNSYTNECIVVFYKDKDED